MKLSKSEFLMLERIAGAGVAYGEDLTRRELRIVSRLERRGLVEKCGNDVQQGGVVLDQKTEDKRHRAYKNRCYRYLVLEALLAFLIGLFLRFLLGLLIG